MVFSSPRFFVFLICLLVALAIPLPTATKKRILCVASCLFYAAWDYRYLGLLLFISVVDYVCALRIDRTEAPRTRRAWLTASVVSNLGVLAYFKYCNFFIENFNALMGGAGLHLARLDILLPAGISFYTFKTMSYTIDVYRRELAPCRSWIDYATFITFFPELIAGPIVRASVFMPQLDRPIGPTRERLARGGSLFLIGLCKKQLVANRVALVADPIFADPTLYSGATLICGVVAYAIQIYADFSGYSDMAIGTAAMLGYDLPENFAMPYLSRDVSEFWRRWHITLSSWLRDYLYIPLGGNRRGGLRTYVNLALTMLLGGLWHGASWNFVLWGALHGAALALHRLYRRLVGPSFALPDAVAVPLTTLFVVLAWIPFRAATLHDSMQIYARMLRLSPGVVWSPTALAFGIVAMIVGHAVALLARSVDREHGRRAAAFLDSIGADVVGNPISGESVRFQLFTPVGAFVVVSLLLLLLLFAPAQVTPFIYFQF